MVRRILLTKNRQGFTLVELLIVMAIIGVMSTIGVPAFRRLIQKSKKSEAKVVLGGIYTAEQAFFAEYGAFGNNLTRVGFQLDGNAPAYVAGFMGTGCVGLGIILPTVASGPGILINDVYPSYYEVLNTVRPNRTVANWTQPPATVQGNWTLLTCALGGASGLPTPTDVYSNMGGVFNSFNAAAQGVVKPDASKTAPVVADLDIWSINEQRRIRNVQDGMSRRQ